MMSLRAIEFMRHLHDVSPTESHSVTQTFVRIFWHLKFSSCLIIEHATGSAAAASGDIGSAWKQRQWQRPHWRGEAQPGPSYKHRNGGVS